MSDLRDIDYSEYIDDNPPGYKEIGNELIHIRAALQKGENLLQKGPQGVGKTLSFEYIACEEQIPYFTFDCSKDTKRSQLVVQATLGVDDDGNRKVEQIPAALPKAMIAANKYGQSLLVLEEINSLPPNMQKIVNSGADYTGRIEIPEAGEVVSLDEDARMSIGGTMNPSSVSGGVFDLNDDLRSRFNELNRGFPSQDTIEDILEINNVPVKIGNSGNVHSLLASFVETMNSHSSAGKVAYQYSPRDAVRFGRMWDGYLDIVRQLNITSQNETSKALRLATEVAVLGKYDNGEEGQIVKEELADVFGISIN